MKLYLIGFALLLCSLSTLAQSLNDAKLCIDAEQYQKAKGILKNLQKTQPDNAEVNFYLGNLYLDAEEQDSALAIFEQGLKKAPKYSLNYVGLGACALEKDSILAKKYFSEALEYNKKKDLTLLHIGLVYRKAKNYKKALEYLQKAKESNSNEALIYLALGETYFAQSNNNEAINMYDKALLYNNVLLRAYVDKGIIWKLALNFEASENEYQHVLRLNVNYGPAYRELAETYLRWANLEPKTYETKLERALAFYKKYLDNTDLSLESRMRYADFLILAKKYNILEQEAKEISKLENKNPRIYRYLGYAAYENGNFQDAENALNKFFKEVAPKRIIARDYYYLGLTQIKLGKDSLGINALKTAVNIDSNFVFAFNNLAKEQYKNKQYTKAADSYELLITKSSKESLMDKFYLGLSYFWAYNNQVYQHTQDSTFKVDKNFLAKADSAFSYVNRKSPTTSMAYYYRAKVARFQEHNAEEGLAIPFYKKYIELLESKPEEKLKSVSQMAEVYNYFGQQIITKDKSKALEYFKKVKELDANNAIANQAIEILTATPPPAKVKTKAKK